MIAAGSEDGNEACALRHDPASRLALDRLHDAAARARSRSSGGLRTCPICASYCA